MQCLVRAQCIGAGSGRHQLIKGFDEFLLLSQLNKAVESAACCKRVRDVRWGAHQVGISKKCIVSGRKCVMSGVM